MGGIFNGIFDKSNAINANVSSYLLREAAKVLDLMKSSKVKLMTKISFEILYLKLLYSLYLTREKSSPILAISEQACYFVAGCFCFGLFVVGLYCSVFRSWL